MSPADFFVGKKMRAFILTIFSIFYCFVAQSQNQRIDTIEQTLKALKIDSERVKVMNTLTFLYKLNGNEKKALETGDSSASLAKRIHYHYGEASAYNNIAGVYKMQSNYPKALEYYAKSMKICEDYSYLNAAVTLISNMANIYIEQGNLPKALEMDLKALDMTEKTHSKQMRSRIFLYLGNIYKRQKNYSSAIAYYDKAITLDSVRRDTISIAINYLNIGNIFSDQGKYDIAMDYYTKALRRLDEKGDKDTYGDCLESMGNVYYNKKDYPKSIELYNQALKMGYMLGNKYKIACNYNNLGNVYFEQEHYKPAEEYILNGLKIADSLNNFELIRNGNESVSKLYEKTGQWTKFASAIEKLNAAKDSLFNDNKSKQIGRLEAQYQYSKDSAVQQTNYANQLAIMKSESDKKSAESKTEWMIIIIIVLLAGMAIILFYQRIKGVEKEKLIVEQQKAWLELKALRTQMNPHFLYNTISSIQSFVLENDIKSSSNYLAQFAGLMRGVLENSRKDQITLAEEIESLKNYVDFEAMRFPSKFKYRINVDEALDQSAIYIPPLLIQPFVENAIWHGLMHLEGDAGQLIISFERSDGHIKCTVDDNGIGFKAAKEMKKNTVHQSLGLAIVKERIDSMNKLYNWGMRTEIIDKAKNDGTPGGTIVELLFPIIQNKFGND